MEAPAEQGPGRERVVLGSSSEARVGGVGGEAELRATRAGRQRGGRV